VHRLPTVVSAFGVALSLERVCIRLFGCAIYFQMIVCITRVTDCCLVRLLSLWQ